jgi:hypothetical protein
MGAPRPRVTADECSRRFAPLDREGDAEPDEDHRGARRHVDDEVVRGRDDGERHRQRRGDGERARGEARRRREHDDPDEQVPAHVQARERRVLVGQPRRLERPVCVRLLGDGVYQPEGEQARRRDREEREEEEPERAGHEEGVAEQHVPLPVAHVENGGRGQDHRPVTPDVHPVGEGHERVAAGDRSLEGSLAGEAERPLDVQEPLRVGEGDVGASGRGVADAEVEEDRERDERGLPEKAAPGARGERRAQAGDDAGVVRRHASSTPRRKRRSCGPRPHRGGCGSASGKPRARLRTRSRRPSRGRRTRGTAR